MCIASCVDRIAVRECERDCREGTAAHQTQPRGTACATHQKRTREKYATKLAALDCICRALVALGQESCCITKDQSPIRKRRGMKESSAKSCASTSCCKELPTKSEVGANFDRKTESVVQDSARAQGCCKSSAVSAYKSKANTTERAVDVCSGGDDFIAPVREPAPAGFVDVEKGTFGSEHVALSISGMTCSGCEDKLSRVLGTLPPITNLKTSLVMARAEFDLDIAAMSPESVMKHLERTTEFKCNRISTQGSVIDVVPDNVRDFLDQPLPLGVNDVQLVSKGIVRINFDPRVVGVRSLFGAKAKYPCQLAAPPTDPGLAAGSKHVRSMGYTTLLSIVLAIPVLVLAWAPIKSHPVTYGAISLALATIIQVFIAGPFYPRALKSLVFSRVVEMDLLIVLSTSAAYVFSVVSFGYLVSGQPLSSSQFFETTALLVTLIMVGRWVAALSRQKAIESVSIRSLQSSTVQLVTVDGTEIDEIDARLLEYGDTFSVLPEHRVPTDGIVISGHSEVDESMLTGESTPIEKHVNSRVIASSINGSNKLIVQLTHLPAENTVSVIANMVDDAKLSKPKIQELADRVASYFVPGIVILTIFTFIIWIGVGIGVQKKSGSDAAIQAIEFAITILIVSCPCAIGLAVPMVVVIGYGVAAEQGIIFKSADSIGMAYKATHVVFDKTGTLTEGKLKVAEEQFAIKDNITQLSAVLGLVANSKHPVSSAVATHLTARGVSVAKVDEIKSVAGKGIEGTIDGRMIRGGSARWLEVESDERVQSILSQGYTLFCIAIDLELFAVFGLSDSVRPEAAATITKLKQNGVYVSLLSGDETGAVNHIATQVGLDLNDAQSRCSPGDKQKYIQELLASVAEKRKATVVFVGDGTNDAVGLAQATIGVHMSSGTDVAQSAADVVLMRPSLEGILAMVDISRAAVQRIKFNFSWSFVYNLLAFLFASGALVSAHKGTEVKIPPAYAGLGELVSVLPVVFIAISLKWAKF